MRANFIHIQPMINEVIANGIKGDFAEFGVWYGTTFLPIAELCRQNKIIIHAVDSFQGMAEATHRDGDKEFRKGALSVGGSTQFRYLAKPFSNVVIHEGFVPHVLLGFDESTSFAFVHLDMDQYEPTLHALRFVWGRLNQGGIVACHDWFPGRNILAAGAIHDWMKEAGVELAGENLESGHAWFRK